MDNNKKEIFLNGVTENVKEEEITLASPEDMIDEAKEIAQNTRSDEKYPFTLYYDANQRDFLLSMLQTVGAIVESHDEAGHTLSTVMNMTQLAFVKRLHCVERVKSNEKTNPFLTGEAEDPSPDRMEQQDEEMTASEPTMANGMIIKNTVAAKSNLMTAATVPEDQTVDNGVAVASVASMSARSTSSTSPCSSMETAKEITDESNTSGCICCPGGAQWFKFTATRTGTYTICTTGSLDTIGTLYNSRGEEIVEVDDYEPCGKLNFRIIQRLRANVTYYIKVRVHGNDTGNYSLKVTEQVLVNSVTINQSTIVLDEGVLYELPTSPNYSYKGYNGAKPIPGLSVSINPSNAGEQKIWWWEQYGSVLDCSYGWDDDGDRYIHVTASEIGTAKLYAQDWNENGKRDECTISVNSTDPFDPSNVEYVRIKKWRSMKTTNGLNYTECDMSTSVTKSYIDDLTYFTVFFPDEDQITTFEINYTLINQLNDIESQYQSQILKRGRPLCFHKGKVYADIFVAEGKIEYASPEYYGIWAYNGNAVCEINDRLSFTYALATIAYSGFMYGFTKITSMQSMQMTSGQTKTYTNSQYIDAVESQKAIADISDDVAVQLGKTDISSTSTARRTWRASEMRVAEDYPTSSGYKYNKSYKIVGGEMTTVPHGTAGSQRPDFYNPSTNHIVEVKNYTVTTSTGRKSLANNIAMQYNSRRTMFPDANIEFIVDVSGQSYTQSMLDEIVDLVSTLTGEDIVRFIYN